MQYAVSKENKKIIMRNRGESLEEILAVSRSVSADFCNYSWRAGIQRQGFDAATARCKSICI